MKAMNKKKILVMAMFLLATIACSVICSNKTYAAVSAADIGRITDKAKLADLKKCHQYFGEKIDILKLNQPSDIVADPGNILALPNGTTNSNGLFNCKTLLNNYMGYSFSDNAGKATFLKKMGYSVDGSSGNKMSCKTMTFTRGSGNDNGSGNDGNGSQNKITICASASNNSVSSISITRNDLGDIAGATFVNNGNSLEFDYDGNGVPDAMINYSDTSADNFFANLQSALKSNQNSFRDAYGNTLFFGNFAGDEQATLENNNEAEVDNIYKKGPLITNMVTTFTEDERLGLLVHYFRTYGNISCYWQEGSTQVTIGDNEYYVSKKSDAPSTFYVVDGNSWFGETDWEGVVGGLNGEDITGIPDCTEIDKIPPGLTEGTGSGAGQNDEDDGPCFDGGVGALGWIICPVVKFMRQGVTIMYDYIIRPFLEIDGQAFKMDGPAFAGWQIFQSFANIVFVIFLLVIIFSQITGVGIDNYGIKRMLPKLIVAAILVNLSYVICQLAVDASNIAGFAVDNLFQGMASNAMQVPGTQVPGVSSQAVGATIIAGTVGIGGAAAAIATAEIWVPAALLALIPALIGIIVSILFVFVILGARQAAAVILVVISPLALVMYMLPNTKKLFDRWLSAFKAVLLVFPICGLLMGGGAFAGALLWNISQDYFLGQLLAALMTVIPFFFIPRILKASMSAIGNIGNMISGAGSAIGRTLGGVGKAATKNSNLYNNMQARSNDTLEARNRRRERRRLEGIVNSTNGPGLSTEQKLRRAKALTALEKMEDEDDFASRPELITSEAASKRFNRKVAAQRAALVANGTTGRIGDKGGFKNDSNSLAYALYNAASEEDRYAAVSELMAGGHHGEQALHEVIDALSQEAAAAEAADPENKDNAARRALESIAKAAKSDKNFGGLKGASRSTYDYINDIASGDDAMYKKDGSLRTMDDAVNAVNFNGMSQEGLVGTNTEELDRYAEALKSGQLDETQAASLVALASSALANERLQGRTKGKVGDALGRIAEFGQHGNHGGDNGGTGAVVAGHGGDSGSGTVLNVPRGNSGGVNPSVVGAAAAGGSGARSTGSTTTGAVVRGRSNVASSSSQSSRTRMPNASEVVRGGSNVASSSSQSSRTRMPNASEIDTTQSGQDQFADYNDGRGRDRR